MPVYIALTVLNEAGRKAMKEDPARIKAHNKQLARFGVKVLAQYATLGQYDFVNVFEAASDDAIYKAAVQLTGGGVLQTITLAAKTADDFIAAAQA